MEQPVLFYVIEDKPMSTASAIEPTAIDSQTEEMSADREPLQA
jgi:hypothetical protein